MDTKHLRAAVAVAEHGSFTCAARHLFMAQSTVTRQVAALERDLGRQLFVRKARVVALTPHGRTFLPIAQEILDAVDRAIAAARGG